MSAESDRRIVDTAIQYVEARDATLFHASEAEFRAAADHLQIALDRLREAVKERNE